MNGLWSVKHKAAPLKRENVNMLQLKDVAFEDWLKTTKEIKLF